MTTLSWLGAALVVFLATVALDAAWVRCVDAVGERKAVLAGFWSSVVCTIGLVGLLGVVQYSTWLAIPEILGAGIGTAVAVFFRPKSL